MQRIKPCLTVFIVDVAIAVHTGIFHRIDTCAFFLNQIDTLVVCTGQRSDVESGGKVLHVVGVVLTHLLKVPNVVFVIFSVVRTELVVLQAHI